MGARGLENAGNYQKTGPRQQENPSNLVLVADDCADHPRRILLKTKAFAAQSAKTLRAPFSLWRCEPDEHDAQGVGYTRWRVKAWRDWMPRAIQNSRWAGRQ